MHEHEFGMVRAIMNRSLKPDKFGPQERIDFALRINAMWAMMLSEGTEEQKEFFKKRFVKFCKMYTLPVPDFPNAISEEGLDDIKQAIEATLKEELSNEQESKPEQSAC